MIKRIAMLMVVLIPAISHAQKIYSLISPDGRIKTEISAGQTLNYSVTADDVCLLDRTPLSLTLDNATIIGKDVKVRKVVRGSSDISIEAPFYRSATVKDHHNALTLILKNEWSIEFRAYDDGVAYRYIYNGKAPVNIVTEEAGYRFPEDWDITVPYVKRGKGEAQFFTSFENIYSTHKTSAYDKERLCFLPVAVDTGNGIKMCITETDLNNYPGMYLFNSDADTTLEGVFARYPKTVEQGGHNRLQMLVKEREDYIAKVEGARNFPWRIMIIGREDKDLAASNLSYVLAEPSKIENTSWIKPGKVAWEWWNAWNIEGVDFKSGINNDTYKFYIDFASKNGIEYVILDEGWAVNLKADLMQVVPEINLEELVNYATERNVGIILWAGYHAFERDMENVCRHYSQMGVKGFKVDFMDRDDQEMTGFNHRAAEMAAKYGLVLDLHGTHKPAGLNRTWPNVLNFEGVHGLEQMKWSPKSVDQVTYDTYIPFIRQAAGPMDYTQGAMRNATMKCYAPVNHEPMSQGTRCRQLALYIILESPLNMLCDSPSNYMKEPECTGFIAKIPTVWDETIIIDGEMGRHIETARRHGDTWYVGGITNWDERDVEIDLSFLGTGSYKAEMILDGVNADKKGSDHKHSEKLTDRTETLKIHLAPGGGFAIKLTPVK